MGNLFTSCCPGSSTYEDLTPDLETRRKQQMEAAERRITEQEHRGIKNIDSVKRQQKLDQERQERQEIGSGNNEGNLKWQVS